ncbi:MULTISPECIES: oligogalacturonate lyase family protein [Asticcacaulis]|uniref:oligogalacturonate lyase family protein n=1 Tax=Asticcacaulis TaxID=76890 RepID=UPI001FD8A725|nr:MULTISPECIES: oligogalacturonate lyase family protein [Asticcacaulis]MBP2161001.1 oligogalacturonide lyase [Asticcacaulis solisilvae]MDR6802046.1 oligogalacturonide lyase [Asticcacaulis sp. BE141]
MRETRRTALKGLWGASALLPLMIHGQAGAQTAPAQPAGNPPKTWVDAKTGHRVVRISDEPGSLGMYFYRHVYTPENDLMVIKSPTGIQTVDLKTWGVKPLVTGPGNDLMFMARKSREAYYSVTDPGEGEAADRPKTIYAVHVDMKTVRRVARIPAGQISAMNADDTLLLGTVAYGAKPLQPKDKASVDKFGQAEYAALGPDGKPLNFAKAKGVRMLERWAARVPAELFTIDIATGERKVLYKTEEWIGHAQFSPTDPNLIRFCMEGPWHRVDRIKLINADGSNLRSVHQRTMNMEIWGHEFFSQDGKWLWYDLQTPRGQVFWVAGLELATGRRIWKRMEQNDWGVHFNVAPDGVTFASDGGDADMVAHAPDGKWISLLKADAIVDADLPSYDDRLISIETFKSTRLIDMSAHDYRLEPNLRFTPDGKWIIFCSNMHGVNHVYAVEVAKAA